MRPLRAPYRATPSLSGSSVARTSTRAVTKLAPRRSLSTSNSATVPVPRSSPSGGSAQPTPPVDQLRSSGGTPCWRTLILCGHCAVDHFPLPYLSGRIGYPRLVAEGAVNTMTSEDKINSLVSQAIEKAEPLVDQAIEKAESLVEKADVKADSLEKVKEKAEPVLAKARDKAEPLLTKAKRQL